MRLFQAALDTCLDSPFFASLSVHGLHFTVYAPSILPWPILCRQHVQGKFYTQRFSNTSFGRTLLRPKPSVFQRFMRFPVFEGQFWPPCAHKPRNRLLRTLWGLGGRLGYFLYFLLGRGEGGVRGDREGGGQCFYWKPQEGGGGLPRGERGGEGPGGCLQRIWGGD